MWIELVVSMLIHVRHFCSPARRRVFVELPVERALTKAKLDVCSRIGAFVQCQDMTHRSMRCVVVVHPYILRQESGSLLLDKPSNQIWRTLFTGQTLVSEADDTLWNVFTNNIQGGKVVPDGCLAIALGSSMQAPTAFS